MSETSPEMERALREGAFPTDAPPQEVVDRMVRAMLDLKKRGAPDPDLDFDLNLISALEKMALAAAAALQPGADLGRNLKVEKQEPFYGTVAWKQHLRRQAAESARERIIKEYGHWICEEIIAAIRDISVDKLLEGGNATD